MSFNTGNKLGSLDERDLYDNAINLDKAMNSTEPTWRDRFNVEKPTIDAALKSAGFMPAGFDFVTGGTLQPGDRNKAVYNPAPNGDNNWYRWNGVFPKEITANSQPNPKDENNWVPVIIKTDVVTRETLRRNLAEAGLELIGTFEDGCTVTSAVQVVLWESDGKVYGWGGLYNKVVPAHSTPALSGGINPGAWEDVNSVLLRSELFNGPLSAPIADGRLIGLKNLPSTKDFTAPNYSDTGVLIDAILAARTRGNVVNSNTPLEVDQTTFYGSNTATNTILSGTSDITGIPRKSVSRPWRGQYVPINTINPEVHLPRMMGTSNPVIVMFGDSISTQGPNAPSGIQSMETLLHAKFLKDNPTKNIKWYNRAIGGQTFKGANGIPSNLDYFNPSWYTDHSRGWWEYVQDLSPDVVIIAFGMNDGGSINQAEFFALMAKIKAWPKVPDLLFVTTPVPSCAAINPYTQYSVHAGQEGRDFAAGLVRSYANVFGHGCIDINRACVAMRDGYDVVSNPTRTEETVNASFYKASKMCTDFSFTAELDCALWDSPIKTVSCRISQAPEYIFLTINENRELHLSGYCAGFGNYRNTPTGYIVPTTGSIFLDVGVFGGVAKLITWTSANLEDRVERALIPLLKLGGEYLPWITFGQGQDTGPFKKITFNRGYKFPKYRQTITDLELWGPSTSDASTKPGFGGNGINHYSSIGLELVVRPVIEALDLSAPTDIHGTHGDGRWVKFQNGTSIFTCKKRIAITINKPSGALFNSGYLVFSDFPKIFKSDGNGGFLFSSSISPQVGGSTQIWIASAGEGTGSINDAIYFSLCSPISIPSGFVDLNITMVGVWK